MNFPKLLVPHGDKLCFIEFVRGPKKPGYQVTRLPGYQVTRLPGYQVTRLPGYQVTTLPGHQVTKLPGYLSRNTPKDGAMIQQLNAENRF